MQLNELMSIGVKKYFVLAGCVLALGVSASLTVAEPESDKSIFLLPSQETPNFYNAKMCEDHQVLSALLTAAKGILKTKVTIAGSDGPQTSYQPDDIHLEAVSILADGKSAIFVASLLVPRG